MLKEGTVTDEDITCIITDIAESPEDVRELLKIIGIDDNQSIHGVGTDETDGALISSCIQRKLKGVSYVGLAAALDNSSLKRSDLVAKHCLINKGKSMTIRNYNTMHDQEEQYLADDSHRNFVVFSSPSLCSYTKCSPVERGKENLKWFLERIKTKPNQFFSDFPGHKRQT